jgi:hypothetical protein
MFRSFLWPSSGPQELKKLPCNKDFLWTCCISFQYRPCVLHVNVSCILLNFDNAIIFAQECTLWRSSLRNFLHSVALALLTCKLVIEYLYLFILANTKPSHNYLLPFATPSQHLNRLTWPQHSNITAAHNRHTYLTVNSIRVTNKILTIVPGFSYGTGKVIS